MINGKTNTTGTETSQNNAAEEILERINSELDSASKMPQNMNTVSLADRFQDEGDTNKEKERMEHLQTDIENMIADGTGTITTDNQYIAETADHELENILNKTASEKVYEAVEDQLLDSLSEDVKNINFGDIHKNVDIVIRRQRHLNGNESELYARAMTELTPISKMLQKNIMNVLKQRQRGATERGLLMGSRLDHSAYYRNDGKIFTKRNRPNDEISLAVGVLVNMSGSMYGERIKTAQAMTLIVYDFCRTLNIPVTIYGHDTFSDTVNLYSFAEFDSLDGNDKFRLMNITDGGQRDATPMLVFFQFIKGISF